MAGETTIVIDGEDNTVIVALDTEPALVINGESGIVIEAGGCG